MAATIFARQFEHFEAHRKGRQTTDITFSMRLLVEKGLDSFSEGSIEEGDLERFYDSLKPRKLYAYLVREG